MSELKTIGILTSGGDAPGMNAAVRAAVRGCIYYGLIPVAIYGGYQGLIDKKFKTMNARAVASIINKGGTCLKSTRCQAFKTPDGRKLAFDHAKDHGLDALVVIGGDGSFTGAMIFEEEFQLPCVGIPATIDNDIYGTDYTIGYDTALNTVVDVIDKIRDTATSHNRLFLIEVMGRNAGFIALNSGIASGAEAILIPEEKHSVSKLMESLQISNRAGKTSSIVVVSEGESIEGGVVEIAQQIEKNFPLYEVKISILGHIQRGGKPSCSDRVLASRLGVAAIETLTNKKSNVMVGIQNQKIVTTSLKKAILTKNNIDDNLIKIASIVSV